MPVADYQHHGTGLLRATAQSIDVERWPDPDDDQDCRSWLAEAWTLPGIAAAIRHASPVLASRVETILGPEAAAARDVRRAALAVVRYVLRASGRPTPFGTFAGVGTVRVGAVTKVRWGPHHRPVVRADARWLFQVAERLEASPELVARLDVVVNDVTDMHSGRWELTGPVKVSVADTSAVTIVRERATTPIGFRTLADTLAHAFPNAGDPSTMLMSLVQHGFLLTSLRVPSTTTDPLASIVERLRTAGADSLPIALHELEQIHSAIQTHNHMPTEHAR